MPRDPKTPERPFALSNLDMDQLSNLIVGPRPQDQAKKWWQSFTKPPKGTYGTDYPIYTW